MNGKINYIIDPCLFAPYGFMMLYASKPDKHRLGSQFRWFIMALKEEKQ